MTSKYKIAFNVQRNRAKARGIGWELTFEEWLNWWGNDIGRRGRGVNDLQMQRFGDSGPYALGNIRKGTPQQNATTAEIVRQNCACERAAKIREELYDSLMSQESGDSPRDYLDEDERELHSMFYPKSSQKTYGLC